MPTVFVPRANQSFSDTWLRLCWNSSAGDPKEFLDSAVKTGNPVDLSLNTSLWGANLDDESSIVIVGGTDIEKAVAQEHAADLLESYLFQALCSLRGKTIDTFFLTIREELPAFKVQGALESLETARADNVIRYAGLDASTPELLKSVWADNDAFEFIMLPSEALTEEVASLAQSRGVGMVVKGSPKEKTINLVEYRGSSS